MIKLVNKTIEILNSNVEWKNRYADYLKDIWNNSYKKAKAFHTPSGLSVYTTFGDRNKKTYSLRFKGQNVGKVVVTNEIMLHSLTTESKSHDIKGCPLQTEKPVKWHSDEASKFRRYFKNLSNCIRVKSPEHHVENSLLKEFRKKNRFDKALTNIQPVLLHGSFFQMPTPLKASSHVPTYAGVKGGGIDILARIRTDSGHIRLCVIEVKDENKPKESQKTAISQAIIYATFIALLLQEQPNWMEFFMGHQFQKESLARTLDRFDIEVVTVMPAGNTETFENEIIEIPDTPYKLHCHSLYYNKEIFEKSLFFDFSGTFLKEIKE